VSTVILVGVGIGILAVALALALALAFVIKDNDYLKTASDSQGITFEALNKTIETQSKYIARLEEATRSLSGGVDCEAPSESPRRRDITD
jgi:hypothetical protein